MQKSRLFEMVPRSWCFPCVMRDFSARSRKRPGVREGQDYAFLSSKQVQGVCWPVSFVNIETGSDRGGVGENGEEESSTEKQGSCER